MDNRTPEPEYLSTSWRSRDSEPPCSERPSVWVLEHSLVQATLAKHVLSSLFDVKLFADSPSLLRELRVEQPDALVLDWCVPEISGLEVLRIVRQTQDEITLPVLMLTATSQSNGHVLEALQVGANDFANKPVGRAELRARVSTLVRIRRLHARAKHAELQHEVTRARGRREREEAEVQRLNLHQVFMQAPTGICLLHGVDHVFQFANPVFCALVGRTDLAGKPVRQGLPELGQELIELLDRVLVTGICHDGRETLVRIPQRGKATPEERYFDLLYQPMRNVTGTVDSVMVLMTDVTTRVSARHDVERASRERERLAEIVAAERNLLTAVLEHTPVGVVVADITGRILLTNPRAELELKHPSVPTNGPADYAKWPILTPEGSPLELESYPLMQALSGVQVHGKELGYRFGDGNVGTLQVSYGPVRDSEGHVSAAVVVFQDVTARKNAELDARKHAEFEEQLIGIVSHDLRTPIGAICLGASLLAEDRTLTKAQARLVERIVSSAGRGSRMVHDLLDFTAVRLSGGLPIRPAPTELHELTQKVVAEVALANPERRIAVQQSGDAHGVWDADRISQMLVNLLDNALRYGLADGRVSIATRGDADHVALTVQNGGAPIAEDLMHRLFLPMQRGVHADEPARRSVGLGLFIVDGIVRAHGGSIEVRSTHAEGTTFVVRLPRAHVTG